jgi:hypothetical protein
MKHKHTCSHCRIPFTCYDPTSICIEFATQECADCAFWLWLLEEMLVLEFYTKRYLINES